MTDDMAALSATYSRSMTEDQLLTAITEAATLHGWRWHHVRRSDKALQQGHPGFPDICAARKGVLLFLELKAGRGRISDAQIAWFDEINSGVGRGTCRLVLPQDLDAILELLK